MSYFEEIEYAIGIFNELHKANSKKEKYEIIKKTKGHKYAEELINLLKDPNFRLEKFEVSPISQNNNSLVRFQNYVSFMEGVTKQKGREIVHSTFIYRLKNLDREELDMYRAIFTKTISLPNEKDNVKKKTTTKEVTKEESSE